ncbi:MAG: carbon starvation protein A [Desulfovibrio sp.]|jgi:carbon starvation protein|nr:carbon starvation protein A [Desulfovibrio sp.]
MNSLSIIGFAIVALACGYAFYGRWLTRKWGIDPNAKTPALRRADGQDYVAAPKFVVFAHQFSSIAGAGPVTGPIIAAMFGWMPVLLWLLVGGIFFGAVHDFGALYASVKNEGKSIGILIEKYIGKTGKHLFLLFSWLFTLLVIAAFSDIVGKTFNGFTKAGAENTPGAAAASISMLYIAGAIVFGLFIKYCKPSHLIQLLCGLGLVFVMMAAGIAFPLYAGTQTWIYIIFAYMFIAAVMPMWLLMQPRDYLSSFLLLGMILGAVVGVVVARPTMNLAAFNGFTLDNGSVMFPALFITIACGAISGFHSMVSANTSSKTISNEKDMLFVGYGAMCVETLLGIVALVVVGAAAVNGKIPAGTPFGIFGSGVAGFLTLLGINEHVAACFMTMCISALALTTLDSVARIGRLSFQELFGVSEGEKPTPLRTFLTNKYVGTIATLFFGYLLSLGGYMNVWPLFGAANQLLAALVLIALAVFLRVTGRTGWTLYVPMTFMLIVTMTSLVQSTLKLVGKLTSDQPFGLAVEGLQLVVAVLLMALAGIVAVSGFKKLGSTNNVKSTIPARAGLQETTHAELH